MHRAKSAFDGERVWRLSPELSFFSLTRGAHLGHGTHGFPTSAGGDYKTITRRTDGAAVKTQPRYLDTNILHLGMNLTSYTVQKSYEGRYSSAVLY